MRFLPLTTISRWGPKEKVISVKSIGITEDKIPGYKENKLVEKFKTQGFEDIITVPAGTEVYVERELQPKTEREALDKTHHLIIRNEYCTILIDLSFDNVLTGDFVADIKGPYDTKGLFDSNLEVFVLKPNIIFYIID